MAAPFFEKIYGWPKFSEFMDDPKQIFINYEWPLQRNLSEPRIISLNLRRTLTLQNMKYTTKFGKSYVTRRLKNLLILY